MNSEHKTRQAPNRPQITDHKSLVMRSALLFAGCVVFHAIGTWTLPLIDRDEPRFAEASREMIQRANYIVPYFNNQLRLDKPPLTYWAQVASYRIFGETDFSARFPSAIAAALVALVICAWGCRIGPTSVGWWAAIMFTLSLQTFLHAKAAVADMWLVLFMTVAYWSGYELLHRPTPNVQHPTFNTHRRWWWIFYLSLALGFLAKGPIAWIPLLTLVIMIIMARDWQSARHLKLPRGILLMLAIVALWGIPALSQTHGQFLAIGIGRHVISRSLATMEGHGSSSIGMYLLLLPFYFITIFVSFFPWSIKLPWLIRQLWTQGKAEIADPAGYSGSQLDTYLITGIATVFVIFTLVATKLPHYTLPAFPLLALLLARHWSLDGPAIKKLDGFKPSSFTDPNTAATSPIRRRSLFPTVAVTTACAWITIALVVPPLVARFFPAYELFQESRALLQPNVQFAALEFEEPSVVWYFRSRVQTFLKRINRKNAVGFMSEPGPRFVIVPTSLVQALFPNRPQTWKFFSTRGFNIVKGKQVELTLVLKQE